MQFNITTDYAIRAVTILALKNRKMTTEEISTQMSIPINYLRKIMKKLNQKGIVDVQRGCAGGFSLAQNAKDINMYDVVTIMEPTLNINQCMEKDCYCSRNAITFCPVRNLYIGIQSSIVNELKKHTIKDLADDMTNGKLI